MDFNYRMIAIITSLLFIGLIIWFVKRRSLNEKFAIFWIILGVIIFFIAIFFSLLEYFSLLLGIIDPNNLLLFGGVIFLLCFCLIISAKISELNENTKILAQQNALLQSEISKMKEERENSDFQEIKKL